MGGNNVVRKARNTAEKSAYRQRVRVPDTPISPAVKNFRRRDLRDILERASARETAARVACGAFAKQLLENFGVEIKSHVIKLGSVPEKPLEKTWDEISEIGENSPLRCADKEIEAQMIEID